MTGLIPLAREELVVVDDVRQDGLRDELQADREAPQRHNEEVDDLATAEEQEEHVREGCRR